MKQTRVIGDKREADMKLRYHWVDLSGRRMYWCGCLPMFRVGDGVHSPRRSKGWKARSKK